MFDSNVASQSFNSRGNISTFWALQFFNHTPFFEEQILKQMSSNWAAFLCLSLFLLDQSPITSLPWQSLRQCSLWVELLDLSKLFYGFLYVVTWFCQKWYMAFSKLLHELSKLLATWICLCCYMDVSKLLHAFLALCQTSCLQIGPRFQSLLKLLFWSKAVDWAEALNAVGQLGLKQCFSSAPCFPTVILCRRTLANLTVVTGYRIHVVKRIIP